MAEKYSSTEQTTHFARISRCIIGPCTEMLRDLLAKEVAPEKIKSIVQSSLDQRKDLSYFQKEKLCLKKGMQTDPNYGKFDISLMYLLYRTKGICCNIEPPSKGWGNPPQMANETTAGDDIERLRLLKDDICSHAHFPAIQTPKYFHTMRELKSICLRFDKMLGKNYHKCICTIENEAMDPKTSTLYAEIIKIVKTLDEKNVDKDNRLTDVEANLKDQANAYKRLETLLYNVCEKVNIQQFEERVISDIRPAKALYPERLLRRIDDVKIKHNYSYLLETINPVIILSQIQEMGIISKNLHEEISECNRKKHKTDRILKSLLRSCPEHYDSFKAVLHDPEVGCSHIVQKLESTVAKGKELADCFSESLYRVESNRRRISEEVNTDDIIHCFLEEEMFSLHEHSDVFRENVSRKTRIDFLLKHIRAYPWCYEILIESLARHNHYQLLVQQIKETNVDEVKGNTSTEILDLISKQNERKSLENLEISVEQIGDVTCRTGTFVDFDIETENAEQIKDEICLAVNEIQTNGESTKTLHGYVENVERGSIKITLSAGSRLFESKLKMLCEKGEIGDFIKEILGMERVKMSLFPEYFYVDFVINIDPPLERTTFNYTFSDVDKRNLLDCYYLLSEEIDCEMVICKLVECGVIAKKETLGKKDEQLKNLLLYLNAKEEEVFETFVDVLKRAGYAYMADVLEEKDLKAFENLSDDDIRVVIIESYTLLLDELYPDRLIKASSQLRPLANAIMQHPNRSRRNGIHMLLKQILQGEDSFPRYFLKSLNYAGYKHVLNLLADKLTDLAEIMSNMTESSPESISFKGRMKLRRSYDITSLASELYSGLYYDQDQVFTWNLSRFTPQTIRENYQRLARGLPAEKVADLLYRNRIFNFDEHKVVTSIKPRQKMAEEILNKILERTLQSQRIFLNILQQLNPKIGKPSLQRGHAALDFFAIEDIDSGTSSIHSSEIANIENDGKIHFKDDISDLATEADARSIATIDSIETDCSGMISKETEETKKEKRLLCGAICFGNNFSGYAFSLKSNPQQIFFPRWKGDYSQSMKAPTCLLLNPKREFDSFGYNAEDKYSELSDDEEESDWYFFTHFKMMLHSQEHPFKQDSMLTEVGGKQISAMTVFCTSIKYLKDQLLLERDKKGYNIKDTEISWVITVPAIWDEEAKKFMQEAAEKADIPSEQLNIALEPEVASIFVREMHSKDETKHRTFLMSPYDRGTKFMVVNLGGGTVDITVNEVANDRTLKKLFATCDDAFGGNTVNTKIYDLIKEVVGDDVMEEFNRAQRVAAYDLATEIELKKRMHDHYISKGNLIPITLPATLIELYEKRKGVKLSKTMETTFRRSVSVKRGKLKVDHTVFSAFFREAQDDIVSYMKTLLSRDNALGLKHVILVGGLADCSIIRNDIQEVFSNLTFTVPDEAGLAVLKGAVLYGHCRNVESHRMSHN